ncbi:MAG TPA: SDR family oxidoreductase [Acidimicrobiia bacterium]|nr:SDR family oxidoreductase [Acidimicrobiia bacterium]
MGLLDGKVAIVSGIGPGLGRHAALQLAAQGAAIVMGARTEDRLKEIAGEIEAAGGRAAWAPTDISDPDQCERLVQTAVDAFGRVDILVNNAFVPGSFQPFESSDFGRWRKVFDVNVFGTLQMTRAVVAPMKAQGGGSIVFVNSMVIHKSTFPQGDYAASKGALWAVAREIATELGPYGIRVNSVVPGWMAGPSVDMYLAWQAGERGISEDEVAAEIAAPMALKRIPTDEECAGAILFLASDLSSAMTGATVDVNGGEVFA